MMSSVAMSTAATWPIITSAGVNSLVLESLVLEEMLLVDERWSVLVAGVADSGTGAGGGFAMCSGPGKLTCTSLSSITTSTGILGVDSACTAMSTIILVAGGAGSASARRLTIGDMVGVSCLSNNCIMLLGLVSRISAIILWVSLQMPSPAERLMEVSFGLLEISFGLVGGRWWRCEPAREDVIDCSSPPRLSKLELSSPRLPTETTEGPPAVERVKASDVMSSERREDGAISSERRDALSISSFNSGRPPTKCKARTYPFCALFSKTTACARWCSPCLTIVTGMT
mmetsp:Transcript_56748/g.146062  ORF Transcript_56748/g.146062 Transcript_56748/m.146062 type:complete len:286 (-) Transcript_56748:118-975(-)